MQPITKTKLIIPKSRLENLYSGQKFSTYKISKIYDCNPETIRRRLIENKIKRDKRKLKLTRKQLERLYDQRLSTLEIAKKCNCSQSAVWKVMKRYGIEMRKPNAYHDWKNVSNLISPKLIMSRSLSYVLGIVLGDGWIYKWRNLYTINLDSKERLFCEKFAKALKQLGLRPCVIKRNNRDGIWRTVGTSKLLYKWFKELKLNDMYNLVSKYPIEFIKGFYESEGCTTINKTHQGKYSYPLVTIVNTNEKLISLVKNLLIKLKFHPTINVYKQTGYGHKPVWYLRLNRREEVYKFFSLIKPCIKILKTI